MKQTYSAKAIIAVALSGLIISFIGCKKESNLQPATSKQVSTAVTESSTVSPATTLSTTTLIDTNAVVATIPIPNSPVYITGFLDSDPVIIEGTQTAYTEVSDSTNHHQYPSTSQGSYHDGDHSHDPDMDHSSGHDEDSGSYKTAVTGGQWMAPTNSTAFFKSGSIDIRGLIVRIYISPYSNNNLHYQLLNPRTLGFAFNPTSAEGAYVTMVDKNGVLWTSAGDQTGSTFVITSRGANQGNSTIFSGTFTARMYDPSGNMKLFTSGTFTSLAGL